MLDTQGNFRVETMFAPVNVGREDNSIIVNDYNRAALAAYHRVGFGQVGEFATVLW